MAWFEFSELCEGPRSQNDYIELARLYRHHLHRKHPAFTPQDEDAARRFIMLIDELYDRGVKIVVSAAAAPPQLYQGDRSALRIPARREPAHRDANSALSRRVSTVPEAPSLQALA